MTVEVKEFGVRKPPKQGVWCGIMLNVASVGIGWWSNELAKSVQGTSEKIRIVSCTSRSPERRQSFAEEFKTAQHDSYEAVLADPKVDGVILTTPHSLHAQHVMMAADAGKHVFVEKPITLTAASGREAANHCRQKGVILAVGQNRRFSAVGQKLKAMLAAEEFGKLLHLEANFSAPGALSYTAERWRASREESPGGGLTALGVHMIDLLAWLAGPVTRVTGQSVRLAAPVDVDDTTSALMTFESGATGYLGCNYACPYTSIFNVYGTAGNAFCNVDASTLSFQKPGEPAAAVSLEPIDTLRAELEEFADACAGATHFRVRPEEAIHTVAVLEAIVASSEKGGIPVSVQ